MAKTYEDEDFLYSNTRKSGRLSILKLPAKRAPLQDLNIPSETNYDEDTATTTTMMAMRKRRVSFTSKTRVKEFIADAETKHLLYTPAYEEPFACVSSDSSQLMSSCCASDVNMSRTLSRNPHPAEEYKSQNDNNMTMCSEMAGRVSVCSSLVSVGGRTLMSPMDLEETNIDNGALWTNSNNCNINNSSLDGSDMCLTKPITAITGGVCLDVSDTDMNDMSFTRPVPQLQDNMTDTSTNDLSFTKAFVPASTIPSFEVSSNQNMNAVPQVNTAEESNNESMSFTKVVPQMNFMNASNKSTMSFTNVLHGLPQMLNNIDTCSSSMSFTRTAPVISNDSNLNTKTVPQKNFMDASNKSTMSFTNVLHGLPQMLNNIDASSSNMSFTRTAPVISDDSNLNTKTVPQKNFMDASNKSTMSFTNVLHGFPQMLNNIDASSSNMSFTRSAPVSNDMADDSNLNTKTVPQKNFMETSNKSTMSFTNVLHGLPQMLNNIDTSSSNMSFTRAAPVISNDIADYSNLNISVNVTKAIPQEKVDPTTRLKSTNDAGYSNSDEENENGHVGIPSSRFSLTTNSVANLCKPVNVINSSNTRSKLESVATTDVDDITMARSGKFSIGSNIYNRKSITYAENNVRFSLASTMNATDDDEMQKLMREVDMNATDIDDENLKNCRLSQVSFLMRENLIGNRRMSTASRLSRLSRRNSNIPMDLTINSTVVAELQEEVDDSIDEQEKDSSIVNKSKDNGANFSNISKVSDIEDEEEEMKLCKNNEAKLSVESCASNLCLPEDERMLQLRPEQDVATLDSHATEVVNQDLWKNISIRKKLKNKLSMESHSGIICQNDFENVDGIVHISKGINAVLVATEKVELGTSFTKLNDNKQKSEINERVSERLSMNNDNVIFNEMTITHSKSGEMDSHSQNVVNETTHTVSKLEENDLHSHNVVNETTQTLCNLGEINSNTKITQIHSKLENTKTNENFDTSENCSAKGVASTQLRNISTEAESSCRTEGEIVENNKTCNVQNSVKFITDESELHFNLSDEDVDKDCSSIEDKLFDEEAKTKNNDNQTLRFSIDNDETNPREQINDSTYQEKIEEIVLTVEEQLINSTVQDQHPELTDDNEQMELEHNGNKEPCDESCSVVEFNTNIESSKQNEDERMYLDGDYGNSETNGCITNQREESNQQNKISASNPEQMITEDAAFTNSVTEEITTDEQANNSVSRAAGVFCKRKSSSLTFEGNEDILESPSKIARLEVVESNDSNGREMECEERNDSSDRRIENESSQAKPMESPFTVSSSTGEIMDSSASLVSTSTNSENNEDSKIRTDFSDFIDLEKLKCYTCVAFKKHSASKFSFSYFAGALDAIIEVSFDENKAFVQCARFILDKNPRKAYNLIFAKKIVDRYEKKLSACHTMPQASKFINKLTKYIADKENFFKDISRLFDLYPLELEDERLIYDAVSGTNRLWFCVTMDVEIIWKAVSDSSLTIKPIIGKFRESDIKHLLRCSNTSSNRLKKFVELLEDFVRKPPVLYGIGT